MSDIAANTDHRQNQEPDPEFIAGQLRKPSGDFAPQIAESMDKVNKPLWELTVSSMQPADDDTLLEIGFGSGSFFEELFSTSRNLTVYGIDYSIDMVRLASKVNTKRISSGQLSLTTGNSDNLPYPDQYFDNVFCNNVIYFWDIPEKHLNEVRRVLKPGGMFYTGIRPKTCMLQLPVIKYGFTLYTPNEWASVLTRNGFRHIEIHRSLDPVVTFNEQTLQMESFSISGAP